LSLDSDLEDVAARLGGGNLEFCGLYDDRTICLVTPQRCREGAYSPVLLPDDTFDEDIALEVDARVYNRLNGVYGTA